VGFSLTAAQSERLLKVSGIALNVGNGFVRNPCCRKKQRDAAIIHSQAIV